MKTRYFVLILICFTITSPTFAAIMDITLIPALNGDCATVIQPIYNFTLTGQVADTTAPDRDWFSIVLFDGDNQPVGFLHNWVTVGFSGTGNNWSFGNLTLINPPQSRPFTIRVYDISVVPPANINDATNGALLDQIVFDPAEIGACTNLPLRTRQSDNQPPFNDGRLNNWDTASSIVVWGHDFETGRGLVVYSPDSVLLLQITPEQIAEIADCPAENTLIVSSNEVDFYRLSSCEFQLNAPSLDGTKTYVLIFDELYANTGYSSYEE